MFYRPTDLKRYHHPMLRYCRPKTTRFGHACQQHRRLLRQRASLSEPVVVSSSANHFSGRHTAMTDSPLQQTRRPRDPCGYLSVLMAYLSCWKLKLRLVPGYSSGRYSLHCEKQSILRLYAVPILNQQRPVPDRFLLPNNRQSVKNKIKTKKKQILSCSFHCFLTRLFH